MYENEEVEEEKGRQFAKEVGAIFKNTSSKNNTGIEELFRSIGNKFIDPDYEEGGVIPDLEAEAYMERRDTVRISGKDSGKKTDNKGGCCKK